jgi:hypothetical protein
MSGVEDDARERAWAAVHDALAALPGWAGRSLHQARRGERWHVAAIDLRPRGRLAKWEAIPATGATEIEAVPTLAGLLRARKGGG